MAKNLLNKQQKKALVDAIWGGVYDKTTLPYWLFDALASSFEEAASTGWGAALGSGAIKDLDLELSMQRNIYYFAAHKTAHELNDMHNIMLISKGKTDFVKRALEVNAKYNKNWYETEYITTSRIARSGREWLNIEETAETFPLLEFVAVMDSNTRDAHAALDGIIRPVNDQFWQKYFPPLDWNCRCTTIRHAPEDAKVTPKTQLTGMPKVQEQFAQRVTDSRKIWHESHPYFGGLDPDQKAATERLVMEKLFKNTEKMKL